MKLLALLAVSAATAAAIIVPVMVFAPGGSSGGVAAKPTQSIVIEISGREPEHVMPLNIAVRPGTPVTITLVNRSAHEHTFTVPGLDVSEIVLAGTAKKPSRATFTFTATRGIFDWECLVCTHMRGHIYAVIEAPV